MDPTFELLLRNAFLPDPTNPAFNNEVRRASEEQFKSLTQSAPDQVALSFIQLIRTNRSADIRDLASVLLRKTLTTKVVANPGLTTSGSTTEEDPNKQVFWSKLQKATQETVKVELLYALNEETEAKVRKQIGEVVSGLASTLVYMTDGKEGVLNVWPDLTPFLFKLSESPEVAHRLSSLDIFSKLCVYCGETIKIVFNSLQQVLVRGLKEESLALRIAALEATVSFTQMLDSPQELSYYANLVVLMFDVLKGTLQNGQFKEARDCILIFVELADVQPAFLQPHLNDVAATMIQVAGAEGADEQLRQVALEFLTTVCESFKRLVRKLPQFIETVVPLVLKFMLALPDIDLNTWNTTVDDEDDEDLEGEVTSSDVGDECLDRMALSIRGKALIPVLFKNVAQLLQHADWKHRHTGLMSMALVAEGCHAYLEPHLSDLVNKVVPGFSDPHPRVRWAALNAVGQWSTDFRRKFQEDFHQIVVPHIAQLMLDKENPKVQNHAASSIINFAEFAQKEQLSPYIRVLLTNLAGMLTSPVLYVVESATTAIAALADVVGAEFIEYYDIIVPALKHILYSTAGKSAQRSLRGKAMECITIIAFSVGKDKFLPDSKEIMNIMYETQQSNLKADDPQVGFLRTSWARVCNTLGNDFEPYLQYIMPPIMAGINIKAEIVVDEEDSLTEREGFHYVPIVDKVVGINTNDMQEKAAACKMIYQYATALRSAFFPYVKEVATALIPLITFFFNDDVRSSTVGSLAALVDVVVAKGPEQKPLLAELAGTIFENLLIVIDAEVDMDIYLLEVGTLCDIIDRVGSGIFTEQQMAAACKLVHQEMKKKIRTINEAREEEAEDEHDEANDEDENETIANSEEAITELADVLGKLLKWNGPQFVPIYGQEFSLFNAQLLANTSSAVERQVGICIFDDLIEFGGAAALQYIGTFLPLVSEYIGDESPNVRQAAVYGMGICAQNGGDIFGLVARQVLERLLMVARLPTARDEDNNVCTENAISAIGRVVRYQAAKLDFEASLDAWLKLLPIVEDTEESKVVYNNLVYFIQHHATAVFGEGGKNLPHILSIFAQTLDTDLLDKQLDATFRQIMQQMQASFPPGTLQAALRAIPEEQRAKLC
eukprot:TRINITY_DN6679_c0_g1_i2.p1 TRINITY_DN6679_c0_g1~~TRINITY_DN6679_c0_g1_i2.p1  ORF type:complete len:1118 (-),score=296.19 TRINITY_DN6679_c0_g1_i2:148-3501(-)